MQNLLEIFKEEISEQASIMLPIFHTSKEDNLISPHYDTFGNFLPPLELELLTARK